MLDRRTLLLSSLSLGACGATSPTPPAAPVVALKTLCPFPVGVCATALQLEEHGWTELVLSQFNQLTPEWQMKMEYTLQPDFSLRFDAPDAIVAFAREHALGVHGHALIWYSQGEAAFGALADDRFIAEFDRYVTGVVAHYRDRVVSWDVVNEPVTDEGSALRTSHWDRIPGPDGHIARAFRIAREADPRAVLFLNDYNLESNPTKGATFLRLVERLVSAGVPIGGIGIQSHLDIEAPAGQISSFMKSAAQFGLPIHVSEVDASLRNGRTFDLRSVAERQRQQLARVGELANAFMDLPRSQQFAFSIWGARDTDSPLRRDDRDDGKDRPVLFDEHGEPNPAYFAVADAFRRATPGSPAKTPQT
ncbi:endo-1,4-beta-xylanase [Brevundimonas intermedia]|uniref:endo-1,4-beta-xylanase n=1 Tax=Brevundimonas intermedia TaxID=74315 RepID=UPI003207AB9C